MGIQAIYIAAKDDVVEKLQNLSSKDLIDELEQIQEKNGSHFDLGKNWDGLHFILTGVSSAEPIEDNELSEFIVGTYIVLENDFVGFSSTKDVARILKKINEINFDDFKKDFNPKLLSQQNIYPNIWIQENKDILFEELKTSFEELRAFYQNNVDLNIIVTIY